MTDWKTDWEPEDLVPGVQLSIWAYGRPGGHGNKTVVKLVRVHANAAIVQYTLAPEPTAIEFRRIRAVRVDDPEDNVVPTSANVALRRIQEMKDMLNGNF